MQKFDNPLQSTWKHIIQRNAMVTDDIALSVREILDAVKKYGNKSIHALNKKYDNSNTTDDSLFVLEKEFDNASNLVSKELKAAIKQAKKNIEIFHKKQVQAQPFVETMPGVLCKRIIKPISDIGIYIPGGTAPLFSTILMLGIPARIAGCKNIIMCTPSKNNEPIHPAILYTAQLCGINKIAKIGGASAIAAMAYGTATIPKVFKIFGPGNQYVTVAKQLVQLEDVAIDMPAGPSEVLVLADYTANPAFVAADLLSQAEHGADSEVVLVYKSGFDIQNCEVEINAQLETLSRKDICKQSLKNCKLIAFELMSNAIDFVNAYAPEHLIISTKNPENILEKIENAGSIFLGNYSPESVGDYASGTNHTLPTSGYAKQYSSVSVDSFVKKITVQELTPQGLKNIAPTVIEMANAELLTAHSNAVNIRLNNM